MKILKRILLAFLVLIVIVVIAGLFLLNNIKKGAIPDYDKNVQLEGISTEVIVLRDQYAIPHIFAKNETDLYKAVGYTMAQDRLWQMDLLRRATQGRLSEMFGEMTLETDHLMRALRIQEKSQKLIKTSDPKIVEALKAFASGVNQYIENNQLPPEFKVLGYQPEPWEPVHSINLIGYMSWDLTSGWNTEILLNKLSKEISEEKLQQLIPDMKNHPTAIFPDMGIPEGFMEESILSASENLKELGLEVFNGSNNWAVSGKKSTSGKPLMANDMHLGLFAPGIWYQMHQVVDGKLNVTGLILPGLPFIIAGHNDSIAWGMTNVMVDDLDFYFETLNDDSTKYLLNGKWKDLVIKNEKITLKGGETITRKILFTHRGPIVNQFKDVKEKPVSIHWLGNEMSNEIRTVFKLNRANNWSEFRDAVKTFKSVSQNIIYADVAGNIGLQTSAGVPIRKGSGIEIYPGDTDEYDWQGLVPFEQLPYEFNPERGYVSSANNKTVPEEYPYYISHWFATPDRINRIREMLEEKDKLGIPDFQAMHSDFNSALVDRMMPHFLPALENCSEMTNTEKEAFDKLKSWDGNLTQESQATSVFEIMYRKLMEILIKDDLSENMFNQLRYSRRILENLVINILPEKNSIWIDDQSTQEIEYFDDIVVNSFKDAVTELTTQLGENTDEWNWSKIHTFTLSHPMGSVEILNKVLKLNKGPFEMPGSFHTVCPYSYSYGNLYQVNHGASHRHIFDVSNWDASITVIPTGTSGIPASDFYCDQTKLYINNQYHADPFSAENVESAAIFEMKILPKE